MKFFLRYSFCLVFLFSPFAGQTVPSEAARRHYAEGIQKAFELQSVGKTRLAFYAFREAYQSALEMENLQLN